MEYEVVPLAQAKEFYSKHPDLDAEVDITPFVRIRTVVVAYQGRPVKECVREINSHEGDWRERVRHGSASASERNEFEAHMAGPIHDALKGLPPEVLDDPDFWRHLGLGPLRWFTLACDLRRDDDGKATLPRSSMETTTASTLREHPVLRTFLRGQMCLDAESADPYADAALMGAAAKQQGGSFADQDVFKSHLIRVLAGNNPDVAKAFLREAADPYMPADEVRRFAKFFRRARTTRALQIMSAPEAAQLARELRQLLPGGVQGNP